VAVTHSADFVSVFVVQEEKASNENVLLGTSCRRLDWQLSFATQISNQLSPLLSSVRVLYIREGRKSPTGEEDVDPTQWLELLQPFTHVTRVDIFGERLVRSIVRALVVDDMATEVLPELTSLRLDQGLDRYPRCPPVAKAALEFVAARGLSGRTVTLFD
jgi:hypothetical protein